MPTSLSQLRGLAASRVSMLIESTSNGGPPSLPCSSSSAGISLRQGTHQVAQRLRSTVRPFHSARWRSPPFSSRNARSGSCNGRLATTTPATSPRASGATRPAVATAGAHWASPARLPRNVLIPYTAASPMATPARLPAATTASRPLAWPFAAFPVSVIGGVNPRQVTSQVTGQVMSNKMWGGRFSEHPDAIMEEINASIDFDRHLYRQDIAASKAHAAMLAKQGILTSNDAAAIAKGLDTILAEIEAGKFTFKRALEDIHMNVESRLAELIGPAAGRLHTARSRNDQVATDFRLWIRRHVDELDRAIAGLQAALIDKAEKHAAAVMPGFTHLQPAQPVTFGHHLLAYVEMAARDRGRFHDARERLNESPLGAAALAGTSFPVNRDMTASALGFDRPMANSLDAVSDRDFVLETLSAAAITAVHLSRFAEEIVIWCSPLVGLISLSDRFTTGSSIMPQKRNPDAAELVRAKA